MPLKMTKGQQSFLDQKARQLTVEWCDKAMYADSDEIVLGKTKPDPYVEYAIEKKWLTLKGDREFGTYRVLGACWETAARFLKR